MHTWPASLGTLLGVGITELKVPEEGDDFSVSLEGYFETSDSEKLEELVVKREPIACQGTVYYKGKPYSAVFQAEIFYRDQFTVRVVAVSPPTVWEAIQGGTL